LDIAGYCWPAVGRTSPAALWPQFGGVLGKLGGGQGTWVGSSLWMPLNNRLAELIHGHIVHCLGQISGHWTLGHLDIWTLGHKQMAAAGVGQKKDSYPRPGYRTNR